MSAQKKMKNLVLIILLVLASPCFARSDFKTIQLNKDQVESLSKLSSIYGYARYFTPNPYIEEIDWYHYMQDMVDSVLLINKEQDVNSFLLQQFEVFIPNLKFSPTPIQADSLNPSDLFYLKVNSLNTGYNKNSISSDITTYYPTDKSKPQLTHYSFPLSSNLYACYSLVSEKLLSKSEGLAKQIKSSKKEWATNFYTNPSHRIANAIITGAYIQHFYAYYEDDNLENTWGESMKLYFKQIASASSYEDYLMYSYMHYANVNDGHLFVMNGYSKPQAMIGKYQAIYYPDIKVEYIENKICVTSIPSKNSNINIGDIVLSVNKQPIEALIKEKIRLTSAATTDAKYNKLCNMFLLSSFKKDDTINLELQRPNGEVYNASLLANKQSSPEAEKKDFIHKTTEGIWCINPTAEKGASYKNFAKHIDELKEAKAIIIDLRGYPHLSILSILSHFIDQEISVGKILTPVFYFPNHQKVHYTIKPSSKWGVHPSTAQYKKEWGYEKPIATRINVPLYFLTNCEAISFAETVLEMVKYYKIGTIIGEATAGTNGDAVILKSPTIGYLFTGYQFFNHDGSKHQGIGILPDIPCPNTIKDIRDRKDTQMIKAIELITNK